MKIARSRVYVLGVLLTAGVLAGCDGGGHGGHAHSPGPEGCGCGAGAAIDGHDHGEPGPWIDDEPLRYDYDVVVSVVDIDDVPLVNIPVDLVVSDVPETVLHGITDVHGEVLFEVFAHPGVMVSAVVDAPGFEEVYSSEFLPEDAGVVHFIVGPRPL